LRWWFVESKEFDFSVVGGSTGIRICEKCKGVTRSIVLDKDEAAWLIKSYDEPVTVQDSRVFWNQSLSRFPRILLQQCSNMHGYFLVVEDYEGRRRSGSILVLKGRYGEGWERFGLELRLADNHLRVGQVNTKQLRALKDPQVVTKTEKRRSFAEVLVSSLPVLEEPFGPSTLPLARVPRWLKAPKVVGTKEVQRLARAA
jgi:hypothetical protein